jgi:hypothetical protein
MQRYLSFFLLLFLLFLADSLASQVPAFPGAGGGGMYATGGRGGRVIYVTSLADTNTQGTLRWAVGQTGARIIMFKVSGTITLTSALRISNGNVTIAGQTAPGDGICLRNYEMNVSADNVIIRFMRFRLGNAISTVESDAIWGRYRKNIIIDHCSMSWSIDECASFYSNENFTLQWSVIAESLNNAGHSKGAHGYGGLWGGKNASFHHNLLAHHNSRNPRFNGWKRSGLSYTNPLDEERVDFRNNVIYNAGDNSSYGGEAAGKYNIVGNYIKYGPATKSSIRFKVTQVDIDASSSYGQRFGTYYIQDNYVFGSSANTQNNWLGVTYASGVSQTSARASVPFACTPIMQHPAEVAFERVLDYAGASLVRDAIDTRIAHETRTGTATFTGSVTKRPGIIDTPNDVGGYLVYNSTAAPADSDNDGIPDGWLEANYPGKTANQVHESGYTYIELYINSLVEHIVVAKNQGALTSGIDEEALEADGLRLGVDVASRTLFLESATPMLRMMVSDLSGRMILNRSLNDLQTSVQLPELKSAVYLVSVAYDRNKVKTFKVQL